MNKAALIDQIAKDTCITKVQAGNILDCFTNAVISMLKEGDTISMAGFGSFTVSQRAARNGRNPQTGTIIKIKATKVPRFKAGKSFSTEIAHARIPKK